jgi:hypothetical protein
LEVGTVPLSNSGSKIITEDLLVDFFGCLGFPSLTVSTVTTTSGTEFLWKHNISRNIELVEELCHPLL